MKKHKKITHLNTHTATKTLVLMIFIGVVLMFLCVNSVSAIVEQRYENYTTNDDANVSFQGGDLQGQTFTVGYSSANETYAVSQIALKMYRNTIQPSRIFTLSVWSITLGIGPNTLLFQNNSINSSILGGTLSWVNLTINGNSNPLQKGTTYAIVLNCSTCSLYDIETRQDITSPTYDGGYVVYSDDYGVTWSGTSRDMLFEIYGIEPPIISEANVSLIYPANKTIISTSTLNLTANLNITGVEKNYTWRNLTIYIWNSTGIFNSTFFAYTAPFKNQSNYTISISNLTLDIYKWNILGTYANNSFSNSTWASSNFTFEVGALILGESYNTNVYETASQIFQINISIFPGTSLGSAYLWYNGTQYAVSNIQTSGSTRTLTKTIDTPLNPSLYANTTRNFYWMFTFSNAGLTQQNTTLREQNISFINLQVCNATYNQQTLNITVKNETEPLDRIPTFLFNGNFDYWIGSGSVTKTLLIQNNSVPSELDLCLHSKEINLTIDVDIDYSSASYSQRSYYLRNAVITNQTSNITLYLLDSGASTSIIVNAKDKYLTNLKSHIVNVLRYYPGYGAYYLVETAKTDDFGNALIKAKEEDVDYKIQIQNSTGSQIYSSNPMRIICTGTPCTLEFITGITEHIVQDLIDFANVQYSLTWNNNTGYVSFEFSDATGLTQSMRLFVTKLNNYGETTICDNTITGASGISTCYIGANSTGTYLARVYRTASPSKYFADLTISLTNIWQTFGTEGLVWMFLFVIIMFFTGLAVGPAIAAVMTLVSIVFMMVTGIVYMPFVVVISVAVVVVIFIAKMRS